MKDGLESPLQDTLTWEEIAARYDQEWVELLDYVWPEGEPYPLNGVVGIHARDKRAFYAELNRRQPKPEDSALLFVGQPPRPEGALYATPFVLRSA